MLLDPYRFGNPNLQKSSLLVSVFSTRRNSNPGPYDQYDIAYVNHPNWSSNFDEFGTNAILSANYYTNSNPGIIYTAPSKTLPISVNSSYTINTLNGFWSGDISDLIVEFLDPQDNVVAAISTLDAGAREFTSIFRYGSNLGNMIFVSENILTNGTISFEEGLLRFTNGTGYGFNGNTPSFTLACDARSIVSARFSGIRVRSTYTGSVADPAALVRFQKIPIT
jgi:hypothetical protein